MRIEEAKKKINEAGGSWRIFQKFMNGQTMGIDDKGFVDIYDWDVERFIRYNCDPSNEPIEEWD